MPQHKTNINPMELYILLILGVLALVGFAIIAKRRGGNLPPKLPPEPKPPGEPPRKLTDEEKRSRTK